MTRKLPVAFAPRWGEHYRRISISRKYSYIYIQIYIRSKNIQIVHLCFELVQKFAGNKQNILKTFNVYNTIRFLIILTPTHSPPFFLMPMNIYIFSHIFIIDKFILPQKYRFEYSIVSLRHVQMALISACSLTSGTKIFSYQYALSYLHAQIELKTETTYKYTK